jgi:hypothetical protein
MCDLADEYRYIRAIKLSFDCEEILDDSYGIGGIVECQYDGHIGSGGRTVRNEMELRFFAHNETGLVFWIRLSHGQFQLSSERGFCKECTLHCTPPLEKLISYLTGIRKLADGLIRKIEI